MNKLMEWFQNVMRQANGYDDLSLFLLKGGIATIIVGILFRSSVVSWLGFLILLLLYIRTFMPNKQKYHQQNRRYHMWHNKIINRLNGQRQVVERKQQQHVQRKTHRFYKCPNCKQKVRVPKGKGKIAITCPSCSERFVKKT